MEKGLKDRMDDGGERRRGPGGQFVKAAAAAEEEEPARPGCPRCGSANLYVVRSRPHAGGWKRLRACRQCGQQWNTVEVPVTRE